MEILDAIRMMVADPDGQFRLKRCGCGSENVVYVQGVDSLWRVQCLDCGAASEAQAVRHDAQGAWNGT